MASTYIEKQIAEAMKRAWELREASWEGREPVGGYNLSLEDACNQTTAEQNIPKLGRIIYLALSSWSNDCIDWAEEILKS